MEMVMLGGFAVLFAVLVAVNYSKHRKDVEGKWYWSEAAEQEMGEREGIMAYQEADVLDTVHAYDPPRLLAFVRTPKHEGWFDTHWLLEADQLPSHLK